MAKTKEKFIYTYIWLDGYKPEPNLRGKDKILEGIKTLKELPGWSFDGSSTQQAKGHFSDCLLNPVKMIPDPARERSFLVFCEVLNPDGTPHISNTRAQLAPYDFKGSWFGMEQEYVFIKNGRPIGFPIDAKKFPKPQGEYYCGVGAENISGRELMEEHTLMCIEAGIPLTGTNAEVLLGQWEFQLFGQDGALDTADLLWLTRYLLVRTAESYGVSVSFHPKPLTKGDWNGSGLHTNFSTNKMRGAGGKELFQRIYKAFEKNAKMHIDHYGSDNHLRLTGKHETQSIHTFSTGVSDRGASIRIPLSTDKEMRGYLEDRRPASNGDPYKILLAICKTLKEAKAD
ncbi:MAG: glutamine synthetase beta-grasp domain-containing protein [Patescibacteria group bacterium]